MPFNQTAKQTEEEEKYGLTRYTTLVFRACLDFLLIALISSVCVA